MKRAATAANIFAALPMSLALAPGLAAGGGHPLDSLEPGHWLEVPASQMRGSLPTEQSLWARL